MKKFTSLIMAVLMLCTMLTVFAVPAFAAGNVLTVSGRTEISEGSYFGINIKDNAELVICGDVKVNNGGFIFLATGSKITVKSGCSLSGVSISFNSVFNNEIKIEDGGKIELSFVDGNSTGYCISVLENSGISYKCEDNEISAPYVDRGAYYQIKSVSSRKVFDVEGGNNTDNYKNGTSVCPWTEHSPIQDNQVFKILKIDDNGKVLISPKYEGNGVLYVNAYGGAGSGVELKLWNDGNSIDSQWYLQEQNNGNYIIKSANGEYYVKEIDGKFILADSDNATQFELNKIGDVTGSIISNGNLWIIIAVAVLALGGVVAIVIVRKKKKTAQSNA